MSSNGFHGGSAFQNLRSLFSVFSSDLAHDVMEGHSEDLDVEVIGVAGRRDTGRLGWPDDP